MLLQLAAGTSKAGTKKAVPKAPKASGDEPQFVDVSNNAAVWTSRACSPLSVPPGFLHVLAPASPPPLLTALPCVSCSTASPGRPLCLAALLSQGGVLPPLSAVTNAHSPPCLTAQGVSLCPPALPGRVQEPPLIAVIGLLGLAVATAGFLVKTASDGKVVGAYVPASLRAPPLLPARSQV